MLFIVRLFFKSWLHAYRDSRTKNDFLYYGKTKTKKWLFCQKKSDLYYFSKGSLHPHVGLLNSDYIISLAFHVWLFQSTPFTFSSLITFLLILETEFWILTALWIFRCSKNLLIVLKSIYTNDKICIDLGSWDQNLKSFLVKGAVS